MNDDRRGPLKLAMLGGSEASAVGRAHRIALRLDRRFEIVAACFSLDADDNRATAAVEQLDPARLYDSLEVLLDAEAEHIDALVIVTPTPLHHGQVVAALDAGVPVICEKSLTATLGECRDLDARVAADGAFLAVTYGYTGYPMVRELAARVDRGDLGRIHRVVVDMPQEGFLLTDDASAQAVQGWRRHDGQLPTVALDLSAHTENLARFIAGGQARRVVGVEATTGHLGVVDDITTLIEDVDGRITSMWCTKTALGRRNGLAIEVMGEDASATWVQAEPEVLVVADRSRHVARVDPGAPGLLVAGDTRYQRFKPGHPAGFIEALANLYADFATALDTFLADGVDPQEHRWVQGVTAATRGMTVLDAAHRSSVQGTWISLED